MKNKIALALILFLLSAVSVNSMLTGECGDKEYLENNSDYIVTGKVIDIESKWNSEETKIYTYTTIEVGKYEKGTGPDKVTIIQGGGDVGLAHAEAEDVAKFELGEQVRLYLVKSEEDYYQPYCGYLGKTTLYVVDQPIKSKTFFQSIIDLFKNLFS